MGETTSCFKLITTLIKLLATFPVNKITFRWYSFRTFYFFASFLLSLTYFILNIYENVSGYVHTMLDVSGVAIQISFLVIAVKWSILVKECNIFDLYMKDYGFPKYLKLKSYIVCVVFVAFFFATYSIFCIAVDGRHTHYEIYTFVGVCREIAKSIKHGISFAGGCKLLFMFVRQLSLWQTAALRCCADIFIITISVVLTARFRQITERVDLLIQKKVCDQNVWKRTVQDYQRFCMFCEKWDDVMGYLVLTSFTSNIYSILIHIEGAIRVSGTLIMLFTTLASIECSLRCILICYTAGNVYEESRRLIRLLILTPSDIYNDEIERIILQLRQGQPALTGKQLFTVTHSLILQIIEGIATHEIVLLQYNTS